VIATRGEDRLADFVGIGMVKCRGSAIAGMEAGLALLASPFQEMAHGARREIEEFRQRGSGFALSRSLPDFLAKGNGDRLGHRGRLRIRVVRI
jgi:hypothetical protein